MNFQLKLYKNNKFTSKFMLKTGIHLGGHISLLDLTTTSVVFGLRNNNIIINLTSVSIELLKVLNLIEGLGYGRSIVYFINSILGFRLAFKNSFYTYNKHVFLPSFLGKLSMKNIFKKLYIGYLKKYKHQTNSIFLRKKLRFFEKSGQYLLRKVFACSKWSYGFISNSKTFVKNAENILYNKVKVGKLIINYKKKLFSSLDVYPFLPHYAFIGDHRLNFSVLNECKMSGVPTSSIIDTFSKKALHCFFGIPGNACSIDSSIFFLILLMSSYMLGYNQNIVKFSYNLESKMNYLKNKFIFEKKNLFFKSFKKLDLFLKK